MVSGYKINMRIKKYFNEFYVENKKMLWGATFGLSVPILLRGLLDFTRQLNKELDEFLNRSSKYYTPVNFIFFDIVPLCF